MERPRLAGMWRGQSHGLPAIVARDNDGGPQMSCPRVAERPDHKMERPRLAGTRSGTVLGTAGVPPAARTEE